MVNPNVTPLRLCDIADEIFHEYLGHYETLLEPDVGKYEHKHHKEQADELWKLLKAHMRDCEECVP